MTAPELRAALDRLGLSQEAFRRHVEALGGDPLPRRTMQTWALGTAPVHPLAAALLALMERAPDAWRPAPG